MQTNELFETKTTTIRTGNSMYNLSRANAVGPYDIVAMALNLFQILFQK